MKKLFSILFFTSIALYSCTSTNKHKTIEVTSKDSTAKETSKDISRTNESASIKTVQVDTAAKVQVDKTNTKAQTSFVFYEIPADATPTYPANASDYFPPGYKTKDGRQFIPVPVTTKEEEKTSTKQENSRSAKNTDQQFSKNDTSASEKAKEVSVKTDTKLKTKDVHRISFSWWWLLLLLAAYLIYRFWPYIKKLFL